MTVKPHYYRLLAIGLALGLALPMQPLLAFDHEEVTVPEYSGRDPEEHPILAPCSRFDDRYETFLFRDTNVEEWPAIYHAEVEAVVQEYFEPVKPVCDAGNYEEFFKPGSALLDLASGLPTWNDPDVPLSRLDTSRVLLEYLNLYECALMEFDTFLYYDTATEKFDEEEEARGAFVEFFDFFVTDLFSESARRAKLIERERIVARKTLKRVLAIAATADRLRPLEAELTCMQHFSLDMRNIASLTAEISSCMPRTWNAKDVLRDYHEEEDD